MPKKVWKEIEDYENYLISNVGEVYSLKKDIILKSRFDKDGYYLINLCKNGKCKTFRVQRLVATAFIKNKENKKEVNHKDCNKLRNCVSNLEWNTSGENKKHGFKNGVCKNPIKFGKNNGRSRKVRQLDKEGNLINVFDCISDVCRKFNKSTSLTPFISRVCRGKQKTAYGFKWEYVEIKHA